uniref:SMR domain protein n=1 Tax=Macrostomum lignano TaxID=282301 RepID=A0A1I8FHI0_9PLAT
MMDRETEAIDLADKDRDNLDGNEAKATASVEEKNVDNAESDDEVEEEGEKRPVKDSKGAKGGRRPVVADSTDDDAGSSRGVRRPSQPRRHRIRTQFPRPAPDLLAAVPGLGHPDLNAGQRRYLRATASIYSVDWAWRALRDGHCDLLKHELGK